MAQQTPPIPQQVFQGVFTAGNPLGRPPGTAALCRDFRVMPGMWLRLRGGRKARKNFTGTPQPSVLQIFPTRDIDKQGSAYQWIQVKSGATVGWYSVNLATFAIPGSFDETISTSFDGGYALTNPAAISNLTDRPCFYNGLGVRDVTNSRPAFTHYPGNNVRYFGLDAYTIGGNPTVAFVGGAGNNQVLNSVKIWVGLYHQATEHYSNGVLAGKITTTSGLGTITVSNLTRLKAAYHNAAEQNELFYVVYATIDGGEVPYLILDSALAGPLKTAITNATISLSVASSTVNGWVLNLAAEMPSENFPPRPMRTVAYVGGRIYGALMSGGSGSAVTQTRVGGQQGPDFTYIPSGREFGAVVWSAAASDTQDKDFLGDPLQSWPLRNLAYTPNGEAPMLVTPTMDGTRVLVLTSNGAFYLEEQADGLHSYITLSLHHGIRKPQSFRVTRYGQMWVDGRNQIILLTPGGEVIIASAPYQSLLDGKTVQASDYLLNPPAEIDRYEVFFTDGTSVCHDFRLPPYPAPIGYMAQIPLGQAYSCSGKNFTAAATCMNDQGQIYHLVANTGIYTQEAQPEDRTTPTTDEQYSNSVDETKTASEISGEYRLNWGDFGDDDVRKELPFIDLTGDGQATTVEWYGDLEQVTGTGRQAIRSKTPQSVSDSKWRYKLSGPFKHWFKLVLKMAGHSAAAAAYTDPPIEGDQANNFYGSVLRINQHPAATENRS